MLSNIIIRSAAAFGGTPFRLTKCTALGSAGAGAAAGASASGVPGALVGVLSVLLVLFLAVYLVNQILIKPIK